MNPRRQLLVKCLVGAALAFGLLQLARPTLARPPVTADLQAPAAVSSILRRACYDCHSNETKLLWFDQIVPAYWLVVHDVKEGRERLNFSEVGKLPAPKQRALLFESLNFIQLGNMPPKPYQALHPEARLGPEDLATLRRYLVPNSERLPAPASAEQLAAAASQRASLKPRAPVAPAPNGIPFFADYKEWRALSTTDRFDNSSLRLILANDVAQRAVAEKRTEPWPDGSAFAKLAWERLPGADGKVQAGQFKQVEFMLKDAQKFAATRGWGFSRWLGTELKPYGKDATFVRECVGCHEPMRDNDFVFTIPVPQADVPADYHVQSTSLDLRAGAMSTLYAGKDGKLLALTWKQRDDPHWFGGKIPGEALGSSSVLDDSAPVSVMP